VSLIYAIWDDENRVMLIANSGQPRPIYCHRGKTQIVEAAGLPLGLLEDADYDEVTIHAHPGDVFVFFSDGIIDAQNGQEELFGRGRVEEVVRRHHEGSADDIVEAIMAAVNAHSVGVEPFDDETVVVVKIKPDGPKAEPLELSRRKRRGTSAALRNV
jgi:sigma-B regulation protein RsbU (phosphoserine phosphatase)